MLRSRGVTGMGVAFGTLFDDFGWGYGGQGYGKVLSYRG